MGENGRQWWVGGVGGRGHHGTEWAACEKKVCNDKPAPEIATSLTPDECRARSICQAPAAAAPRPYPEIVRTPGESVCTACPRCGLA